MRFWCPGNVIPICVRSLCKREGGCESRGSNLSHPPMPVLVLPGPRVLTQLSAPAHTPWCPAQPSGSARCSASCVWIQATQRHFDKGSHQSRSGWAGVGSLCGKQGILFVPLKYRSWLAWATTLQPALSQMLAYSSSRLHINWLLPELTSWPVSWCAESSRQAAD